MFTSRAEHRLMLDADSADARLTPHGRRVGLVGDAHWERFIRKRERMERYLAWLRGESARKSLKLNSLTLESLLSRPGVTIDSAERAAEAPPPERLTAMEKSAIEARVKYRGYVAQQHREVERISRDANRGIPQGFDFSAIPGLSREIVEKLSRVRPRTLGHAGRISGVTPAAVSILRVYVSRAGTGREVVPVNPQG